MTCLNTNYPLSYDKELAMLERLDVCATLVCATLLSLGPHQVPMVDFHTVLCRDHATTFRREYGGQGAFGGCGADCGCLWEGGGGVGG